MHPSEMNNDQLRLAIARIIAKQRGWLISKGDYSFRHDDMGQTFVAYIPNYPGDPAAALGLIDDGKVDFARLEFLAGSWQVNLSIGLDCSGRYINTSLARAISEARYKLCMVMAARRSDESH